MIQVNKLSKAYGRQTIFDEVDFTINPGERVGLVGRNGHGKTTLFRMILGEAQPDSGTITIPNGYRIGHLSQHLSFSEDTVLKEGCLNLPHSDDGTDESYKVAAILHGLGFSTEDFDRHPSSLSGGFQIRLNLAKVLVSEPNLLLLDEPTNYLDIVSIRWLIKFLRAWRNEMIIITHDREFMDSVTTHTLGIHRQKMRKIEGSTEKLYAQILLDEEVYEKTRINDERKRKDIEQFINRFRAQANKAKAVQSRIKALERHERFEKLTDEKTLDFAFRNAPFTGKQLMTAEDLTFSFGPDLPPIISGFNLAVGKNDRIAIIGKNGKGKTTLLNLLAGELSPVSGTINNHPQLQLAFFGQTNINRLDLSKTVEAEIMDVHPDHNRGAARKICGAMMFEGDLAEKKISVLSGGERSRVLLGKLLVSPANMLLLDEPTNHLDMESIDSLIEAIEVFKGAVVIVTHSELVLHAIATRLVIFDGGSIRVFEGTYEDFLKRVGWSDEGAIEKEADRPEKERVKGINKKELRRMRAEIITNRSKTLNPLQKRIEEIEKTISKIEKQVELDTHTLLDISLKGDGEAAGRLSKAINVARKQVDTLFAELENATALFESKSREFEELLRDKQETA
ncbi:MAG: ABC-F family ATP-binding cassette domain-containing protein [Nitrospirae bacterium]|nr:ABC-F family ATP-binding cassette domain-containing protein [Nitrospirota bacterium]